MFSCLEHDTVQSEYCTLLVHYSANLFRGDVMQQRAPGHVLQHDVVKIEIVVVELIDLDDIGVLNSPQYAHLYFRSCPGERSGGEGTTAF